jgi:hypothetical protein
MKFSFLESRELLKPNTFVFMFVGWITDAMKTEP